ncbi:MAG: hypothetical protein II794_01405 [Oscillospiraceae bacterium]|nr:hypothetical protein [Oscillospiraceae bacterium]
MQKSMNGPDKEAVITIILGIMVILLIALVITAILALAAEKGAVSLEAAEELTMLCSFIGGIAGGAVVRYRRGKRGAEPIISAVGAAIIRLIISLAVSGVPSLSDLGHSAAIVAGGLLAAAALTGGKGRRRR